MRNDEMANAEMMAHECYASAHRLADYLGKGGYLPSLVVSLQEARQEIDLCIALASRREQKAAAE